MKSDPGETRDVSSDPANQEILEKLQQEMIRIFMDTHPQAGNLPDGLSVEEKLVWFCEPPDDNPDYNAKTY